VNSSTKKIIIKPGAHTLDIYEDNHILKKDVDFSKGLTLELGFRGILTKGESTSLEKSEESPLIQYIDTSTNQLIIKDTSSQEEFKLTLPPHLIKAIQKRIITF